MAGKVAVVTGGSRGIGAMIAGGLVQAGCRVYITARKAEACDAKAAELSQYGECVSMPLNLADPAAAATARRARERARGPAAHPGEQRGRHLGRAAGGVPAGRVRQALGDQRQGAVPADPAQPAAAAGRGSTRRSGPGHQRRLDRRPRRSQHGDLRLQRHQGRRAHADPAPGEHARARVDHGERDRARPVRQQDDGVRAGQPGHPRGDRGRTCRSAASASPTTWPARRSSSPHARAAT